MSPEYQVVWEGKVKEVYTVEAASEEEARETWAANGVLGQSEAFDGEVVEIIGPDEEE